MSKNRQATRDISYAYSAQTRGGRAMIRFMENASGRLGLIRRARGYEAEMSAGRDFWQIMVERYGLGLDVIRGSLEDIPKEGPLIVIANHPYGILDGLILGSILSASRGDFKILANSVFTKNEILRDTVLPISFDEESGAQKLNKKTILASCRYVQKGGCLGMFPSGTVATSREPFSTIAEPLWPETISAIAVSSKATIVPIYFHGANSRLFQVASHLHGSLRLGMFVREFRRSVDKAVKLSIGDPLTYDDYSSMACDKVQLTRMLRSATLKLGNVDSITVGRQYLRGV